FDTDKNASILLIKQVNKSEHENEYIYHVVNEFENVQCQGFVEQYPIEYQAEAYPEAIIQWTRNGEIISSLSNEFCIKKNRLIILETKLEHTGTYAIKLTNEVRKIELAIELAITERLIEVGKHFIDIIVLENGTITFECVFTKSIECVKWL
ncbi:unnamed protein product, partial [Rotaria sp. Silwood1]